MINEAPVIVVKRWDARAVMHVELTHLLAFGHAVIRKEAESVETRPTNPQHVSMSHVAFIVVNSGAWSQ